MKKRVPNIVFSTDIIVGFPGETEEDFEDTLDVVKKVHFEQVFMFIYSRRVGTPGDRMENHWSGKCTILLTFSQSLIASITSSVKSFGCGDTKRIFSIPSILFTILNSFANEFTPSYSSNSIFFSRSTLKYELTFCPNRVISFTKL